METCGRGNLLRITVKVGCSLLAEFENTTMDAILDEPAQVALGEIYIR